MSLTSPPSLDDATSSQNPAQASEDSVTSFMALDEDSQTKALSKMSPEAKQWLLTGIKAQKAAKANTAPTIPSTPSPASSADISTGEDTSSSIKGFADSVVGAAKGIKNLFMPTAEPGAEGDVGKGIEDTYVTGAKQAKEQFKAGAKSIREGSPYEGALQTARGVVTGTSLLDPFATGPVVSNNQQISEGKFKEALGSSVFDLLTLWGGKKIGSKPNSEVSMNKIVSATGLGVKELERTMPDLVDATKQVGRAETVGEMGDLLDTTLRNVSGEFDKDFALIKNQKVYSPAIRNHIDRILRDNPQWNKTDAGRAKIAAMNDVLRQYDRPGWTFEEMNKERADINRDTRRLQNMSSVDSNAALKSDAELQAKKIVANVMGETVNEYTARAGGKDPHYYDITRQKQDALITMKDQLEQQIENLRNRSAAKEGQSVTEKLRPRASMGAAGPRVHLPIGEAIPSESEAALADSKVKQAFQRGGPQRGKMAARAAILALPLSQLATTGQDGKKSRTVTTPPPNYVEHMTHEPIRVNAADLEQ